MGSDGSGPSDSAFMINYRVDNLDELLDLDTAAANALASALGAQAVAVMDRGGDDAIVGALLGPPGRQVGARAVAGFGIVHRQRGMAPAHRRAVPRLSPPRRPRRVTGRPCGSGTSGGSTGAGGRCARPATQAAWRRRSGAPSRWPYRSFGSASCGISASMPPNSSACWWAGRPSWRCHRTFPTASKPLSPATAFAPASILRYRNCRDHR